MCELKKVCFLNTNYNDTEVVEEFLLDGSILGLLCSLRMYTGGSLDSGMGAESYMRQMTESM